MIFYKCYGNHDKNKDIDVDKLPEKERKYYVFDINNNNDIVRDNDDYDRNIECPICRSRKHLVVESILYCAMSVRCRCMSRYADAVEKRGKSL